MALTFSAQLRKVILKRRAKPSQQFGQSADSSVYNGATGCTHTVLQFLIWLWTGKWVSLDTISRVALYPWPKGNPNRRGLRPTEVQRVIRHYGLPYKVVYGLTALEVAHASKKGPVGFGHVYGWWPEWKGYHYAGAAADGKPNGYAKPLGHAGRTQLIGFNRGAHFGMLLGYASDPTGPDVYYAWEPNHNSPSRREKPAYDKMSFDQFSDVYNSYNKVLGRARYALIPTKTLPA